MSALDKIVAANDLRAFFFQQLTELNNRSNFPLTQEKIFYSSTVLEKFNSPQVLFEYTEEGKIKEKALGIKFLEASNLNTAQQLEHIKDIAESALFLCGYFRNSRKNKLVNLDYYVDLGKQAYCKLNSLEPIYLDVPLFFDSFSQVFEHVSELLNLFSTKVHNSFDKLDKYSIT